MTRLNLTEARPLAEAQPSLSPSGRLSVQLITPGWGSSGYYSETVLTEAARSRVFPAGTQMFLDHPTVAEAQDRPERSVRDLAAVLTTDAAVSESGALVAEAQVFAPFAPVLTEMRDAIGLSIRAFGHAEVGEAEGRSGQIITSLDEGLSVDFVTAAGRGGRILEVLESAGHRWAVEATANDTRDALCTAVSDAYGGDNAYAWVRDYDPDAGLVYFDVSGDTEPRGTFSQGYALAADGSASLTGERTEVTVRTTYVPVSPAGSTTTQESEEDTMPQIEEARLRQLEADAGRVQTLESERDTAARERDEARTALAERDRRDAARPVIAQALTGTPLNAASQARVTEALLTDLPAQDDGTLDEAALTTAATAARTAAETEIAAYLAEHGVGTVRAFGEAATTTTGTGGDTTEKLEAAFAGFGLSESAAKLAAAGRD